ncbi:hypothetical protein THAOC_09807, partial [Thalassiosira oceanica]
MDRLANSTPSASSPGDEVAGATGAARKGGGRQVRRRHVDELQPPLRAHARRDVHGRDAHGRYDARPRLVPRDVLAPAPDAVGPAGHGLPPDLPGVLERLYRDGPQALDDGVAVDVRADLEPAPRVAGGRGLLGPAPLAVPLPAPPVACLADDRLAPLVARRRPGDEVDELLVVYLDDRHRQCVPVPVRAVSGDGEELPYRLHLHAVVVPLADLRGLRRHVEPVEAADQALLELGEDLVLSRPGGEDAVVPEARRGTRRVRRALGVHDQDVVRGGGEDAPSPRGADRGRTGAAVHPDRAPDVLQLVEQLETHGALGREPDAEVIRLGEARGHGPAGLAAPLVRLLTEGGDAVPGRVADEVELPAEAVGFSPERRDPVVVRPLRLGRGGRVVRPAHPARPPEAEANGVRSPLGVLAASVICGVQKSS